MFHVSALFNRFWQTHRTEQMELKCSNTPNKLVNLQVSWEVIHGGSWIMLGFKLPQSLSSFALSHCTILLTFLIFCGPRKKSVFFPLPSQIVNSQEWKGSVNEKQQRNQRKLPLRKLVGQIGKSCRSLDDKNGLSLHSLKLGYITLFRLNNLDLIQFNGNSI